MNSAPLSPELRAAAPALGGLLGAIFLGLAELIAHAFLRNPLRVGIIVPLWTRLKRAARRLDRLVSRIAAGKQPRAPHPGRQRYDTPAPSRPKVQLPTTHAWLLKDLKHEAALYHNRLDRLLNDPANAALIAHSPQLVRLLRPLCRMLGLRHAAVPPLPRLRPPAPPAVAAPRATPAQPPAGAPTWPPAPVRKPPSPSMHDPDPCPHVYRWPFVPWTPKTAT